MANSTSITFYNDGKELSDDLPIWRLLLDGTYTNFTIQTNGQEGDDTLHGSNVPGNWAQFGAGFVPITVTNLMQGGVGDDVLYSSRMPQDLTSAQAANYTHLDALRGGDGDDVYVINNSNVTVIELANEGYDTVSAAGRTLWGVDYGNVEALRLTGTGGGQLLGGGSIVELIGSLGNDQLSGGDNAELLRGRDGFDIILGGAGDDTLIGGLGDDQLNGQDGSDLYIVESFFDLVIDGGAFGTDTVQSATMSLVGVNFSGIEQLQLSGTENLDASAGEGNLVIIGNAGDNVLTGRTSGLVLNGRDGADTIYGGTGEDTIYGGRGADSLAGGLGDDVYFVGNSSDLVTEANSGLGLALQGEDTVTSASISLLGGRYVGVETLLLSGQADLNINASGGDAHHLVGNDGSNRITGVTGSQDTMAGNGGDDMLFMGTADIADGGEGSDRYVLADVSTGTVTIDDTGSQGTDRVVSSLWDIEGKSFSNIEILQLLGTANLNATGALATTTILGNAGNNILTGAQDGGTAIRGGLGDDTLIGGSGADSLSGGGGDDSMSGHGGDDTYLVDSIFDTVREIVDNGDDTVMSASVNLSGLDFGFVETLAAIGTADLMLSGGLKVRTLIGNSGDNILQGTSANETLTGGAGNDVLTSNGGLDSMDGGDGDDTYVLSDIDHSETVLDTGVDGATPSYDSVQSSTVDIYGQGMSGIEAISLQGNANLNIYGASIHLLFGNDGDNMIFGGSGVDSIYGGAGADTIYGDGEFDVLTGNAGADVFAFGSHSDLVGTIPSDSGPYSDRIADFEIGTDRISLAALGVAEFVGGAGFNVHPGFGGVREAHIFANGLETAILYIDEDGDGAADSMIELSTAIPGTLGHLTAADFVLQPMIS